MGRPLAEDGVSEALLCANVWKEARGHAPAKKIVENGHVEAVFVTYRNRWDTNAEMDLFEVALGFEMDGRFRVRSAIVFGGTRRAHVAELALNQFEHFLVRDVFGRGGHQGIGGKPVPAARK